MENLYLYMLGLVTIKWDMSIRFLAGYQQLADLIAAMLVNSSCCVILRFGHLNSYRKGKILVDTKIFTGPIIIILLTRHP